MTIKSTAGDHTRMYTFEIGAEIIVGALIAENFYLITKKGTTSSLPDGLDVGHIFIAKAGTTLVSGAGDGVEPLVMSQQCGMQDIGSTLSRDAIDVTTLCDTMSTFVPGKLNGEISGTMVIDTSTGEETTTDVILGNLIELLSEQTDGSFTASTPGEQVNVAILLTEGILGESVRDMFLFAPAFITSSGFTGGLGSAKTGDVSISIAKGDFQPHMLKTIRL